MISIEERLLLQTPTSLEVEAKVPEVNHIMTDRALAHIAQYVGALVARCELLDKQMIQIESRLSKLEAGTQYVFVRGEPIELPSVGELNQAMAQEIDRTLPASLMLGDKE